MALNEKLDAALDIHAEIIKKGFKPDFYPNIAFIGPAGSGKTARIKK